MGRVMGCSGLSSLGAPPLAKVMFSRFMGFLRIRKPGIPEAVVSWVMVLCRKGKSWS